MAALYGALLAGGVFGLEWIQSQFILRGYSRETLLVAVGLGFAGLGVWLGVQLTRRSRSGRFERNAAAQASLGLTAREMEVLDAIAEGQSNKEIARTLGVSPNTVKTHITHLFEKLDVSRRVQALEKSRQLGLIP